MVTPDALYTATSIGVMVCWIVFAAAFFLRKRRKASNEHSRDNQYRIGLLFEAAGFACVWMFRRKDPLLFVDGGVSVGIVFSAAAVLLAVLSVAMVVTALKTLGKQWAVAARLVEDHRLITGGPYGIVRNPIYSGMFGMLIATGFALSTWYAVVIAVPLFWFGTVVRVRTEEKLLREAFGDEFEQYKQRVPSLLPRLFRDRD